MTDIAARSAEDDALDVGPGDDLSEMLDRTIRSQIGRLVVPLTTLLLPIIAAVGAWLQEVIGIDMNEPAVTALVASTILGGALLAWQWLRNRGHWEKDAMLVLARARGLVQDAQAASPPVPIPDISKHPDVGGTGEVGTNVSPGEPLPSQPPGLLPE